MHAVGVLESGLCRHVLISYGHCGRSGDSMMKLLSGLGAEDAVYGHFGATGGYALAARRAMHELGLDFQRLYHHAKFLYRLARRWESTPCIPYLEDQEPQPCVP